MPIQFINNAAIDAKARKLIRSHAAKGGNIGKKRPSKQRQSETGVKTPAPIYGYRARSTPALLVPESESDEVIEIERQLGDGLSVLSLPAELNATSKDLFTNAFSFLSGPVCISQLCGVINFQLVAQKRIWIQSVFLDEAYFHCIIALFVAVVKPAFLRQGGSIETMYHLSKAYQLVNEKLSGSEALSETTMLVIIAMIHYEQSQGQYGQAYVHFKGLKRVIALRGGISQLITCKPGLAQKIFGADLEIALHLGPQTHFRIEDLPKYDSITLLRNRSTCNQKAPILDTMLFTQLNTLLQHVLLDIAKFARFLNNSTGRGTQLDSYTFHDMLIAMGYRLIQVSPLVERRPMSRLENMLHLGLTAFLTTFLLGFSCGRSEYPILVELTRSALQGQVEEQKESQELFLWALFIGSATIFDPVDETWLIPKLEETISFLGLCTWEDTCQILLSYPWVNAVHEKECQELWFKFQERVFRGSTLTSF